MTLIKELEQQPNQIAGHKELAHKSLLQSDALYQVRSITNIFILFIKLNNFILFFHFTIINTRIGGAVYT